MKLEIAWIAKMAAVEAVANSETAQTETAADSKHLSNASSQTLEMNYQSLESAPDEHSASSPLQT